jgi:hypothetical protein
VFGFDEHRRDMYALAHDAFSRIKAAGAARTMTTLYDPTYGAETRLGEVIDAYVPNVWQYDRQAARQAREQGREVWWRDASLGIECDASQPRLLAWRTMAQEVDGLLVRCINHWADNEQYLAPRLRTQWHATTDGHTPHAAWTLVYPGEDGPISSIRLENLRDGIEDYDLMVQAARDMALPTDPFHEVTGRLLLQLGLPEDLAGLTPTQIRAARRNLARLMQ